jgi:hypothetical protein
MRAAADRWRWRWRWRKLLQVAVVATLVLTSLSKKKKKHLVDVTSTSRPAAGGTGRVSGGGGGGGILAVPANGRYSVFTPQEWIPGTSARYFGDAFSAAELAAMRQGAATATAEFYDAHIKVCHSLEVDFAKCFVAMGLVSELHPYYPEPFVFANNALVRLNLFDLSAEHVAIALDQFLANEPLSDIIVNAFITSISDQASLLFDAGSFDAALQAYTVIARAVQQFTTSLSDSFLVNVCVLVCERARCVRVHLRACERASVRACVHVCVPCPQLSHTCLARLLARSSRLRSAVARSLVRRHRNLGMLYEQTGHYDACDDAFSKALDLAPDHVPSLSSWCGGLVQRCVVLHDTELRHCARAEQVCGRVRRLAPDDVGMLSHATRLLVVLGRYAEAVLEYVLSS